MKNYFKFDFSLENQFFFIFSGLDLYHLIEWIYYSLSHTITIPILIGLQNCGIYVNLTLLTQYSKSAENPAKSN